LREGKARVVRDRKIRKNSVYNERKATLFSLCEWAWRQKLHHLTDATSVAAQLHTVTAIKARRTNCARPVGEA
jgi:hypothetical protein